MPFLDFDAAMARITAMSTNSDLAEENRRSAIETLEAADMGYKLATS
jgi:hypothetical protein